MPALQFTPGPIQIYLAPRSAGDTFTYAGTCVTAPEPEGEKFKLPIMNDLSGRSVPFQLVQDGEMWNLAMTLNRFDIALWRTIRALESGGAALGSESGDARGTMVLGISDFQMVLINTYAGTPAGGPGGAGAALNSGRGWFSCNLRKYKESTVGTRVLEIAVAIEMQNLFDPATRGFHLYTESGLPSLPSPN